MASDKEQTDSTTSTIGTGGTHKRKILFAMMFMNVGGVEKALFGMLSLLSPEKWDVSIHIILPSGGLFAEIPKHVHVKVIESLNRYSFFCNRPLKGFVKMLLGGRPLDAANVMASYAAAKIKGSLNSFTAYLTAKDAPVDEHFDIAVSYPGPSEYLEYYVAHRISAEKKYAWIHFDISKCHVKPRSVRENFPFYDRIFVVSQNAKEILDKLYPEFADKTECFPNIVSRCAILRQANEPAPFEKRSGVTDIVTVGRLSVEKGQDLAIRALKLLADKGYKLHWHFVGDGAAADSLRHLAHELQVEKWVTFHGVTHNPYPYMRCADIYMQPSRHEGFGLTIQEAMTFGAPIVSTDTAGGSEQLKALENGVVTGFTPQEIAEGIEKAMKMPRLPEMAPVDTPHGVFKKYFA